MHLYEKEEDLRTKVINALSKNAQKEFKEIEASIKKVDKKEIT